MFLLQIAQAPVVVRVADESGEPKWEVVIPKYKLGDAITWGAAIKAQWTANMTANMDERRAHEMLALNPQLPPTINHLKTLLTTPEGALEVLSTQIPKSRVFEVVRAVRAEKDKRTAIYTRGHELPPEKAKPIHDALLQMGAGPSCHIAWEIADIQDASIAPVSKVLSPEDEDGEEGQTQDPLSNSGGTG